jgi:hypothetical protein
MTVHLYSFGYSDFLLVLYFCFGGSLPVLRLGKSRCACEGCDGLPLLLFLNPFRAMETETMTSIFLHLMSLL